MIVFLDRQHHGKPNKWNDCGASNGDIHETWLTSQYIHHCEWKLRAAGIDVCVLSDGWYSDRHERVNKYAQGHQKSIYVSCHINAGGGDYGAVFYDHRSQNGKDLAHHITARLHQWCDPLHNKTKSIPCQPEDWTAHAFNTIKGVGRPVAVCFEPFFIDCEDHKDLMTPHGLELVGISLATAIKTYLEE